LSIVQNIVTRINSDGIIGGCFGLYPSYVAGILNSAETVHSYVLYNKRPNYTDIILKSFLHNEKCRFQYKAINSNYFIVSCGGEEIGICFEERILDGNRPSELTFAQGLLRT
jgi:hypothetical protein